MGKTITLMIDKRGAVTNGDVIKAMWNAKAFSYVGGKELEVYFCDFDYSIYVSTDWWNSPYKEKVREYEA